jgi:hypothetical protein
MITLRYPPQAGDHCGTTRQTEMEWEEALFLRLGAERHCRTKRPIIDGKPLEPGGSQKERQPGP